MKKIGIILFIIPLILTTLQVQAFFEKFISESSSRTLAYANLGLIFMGIIFFLKDQRREPFTKMIKLWLIFYGFYFGIGLLANTIHQNEVPLLKTLIPVIYFIGFSFFLSIKAHRKIFEKAVMITFTISNILLIYFYQINFSMDYDGIYEYSLERAGGVYGDANNAAVVCLLSFIFIYNYYKPRYSFGKMIKFLGIGIALYSLILTFSKTGFVVLILVLSLTFHRFFSPKKIIPLLFIVPISFYLFIQSALHSPSLSAVQKTRIQDVVNIITLNTSKVHYSDRDVLFDNMLNFINLNPVLGNGIYFSTSIRGHNTIFGIWADAGIFCFLFFLFVLFQYVKKGLASTPDIKFPTLSIITVLGIFMLSLQTIIDQAYLIAIFVYLAYIVDNKRLESHY
tara:strand:- start:5262 stop:6449 length:1188 start_codon:yes stop_codon:yes gene_type:complete